MGGRGLTCRLAVSAMALMTAMLGLGSRLAFLHLAPEEDTRRHIEQTRSWGEEIQVPRGNIYDRSGQRNILALDLSVKHVCVDPSVVLAHENLADVATCLAETLDLPPDEVAVDLNRPSSRYVRIKRYVETDRIATIRKHGFKGVFFEDAILRFYPQNSFMCHVLGFVNHEGVASAGVEQWLDDYLRGCPGYVEGRKDAFKHEIYSKRMEQIPALDGANVRLTLDQNIQYVVEQALDEVMDEHKPNGAWAIVQDVQTGRILAMASRPCFDLNTFYDVETRDVWRNRAIGNVYEPGSTFKALTVASALNEAVVTPETVFDCENGCWFYAGRPLRDSHAHDRLTVADGLKKSSNILTAKVALRLGERRLYKYLNEFGIGSRLGIDLPGEEHGLLRPVGDWSRISPTRIAIGQGVAVTALQMLSVFSTIANDGRLMRPFVVDRVWRDDAGVLLDPQPEVLSQPIRRNTATLMRRLLARVTEDGGTGTRARVDGYEVAGKTGTAQKPEPGGYSSTRFMSSFVGFLPARRPAVSIIVVVDEPHGKYHSGGRVAAPAFARIAAETVRYLDVPPAGATSWIAKQ